MIEFIIYKTKNDLFIGATLKYDYKHSEKFLNRYTNNFQYLLSIY